MEDDLGYRTTRRRMGPLLQASLALLVAGTLVTFSFLAFRTGLAEQPRNGVTAREPRAGSDGRPVLLPSPGQTPGATERNEVAPQPRAFLARATTTAPSGGSIESGQAVLGSRTTGKNQRKRTKLSVDVHRSLARSDDHSNGAAHGHDEATGRRGRALGHDKRGKDDSKAKGHGRGHSKHDHHSKKGRGHRRHGG